MTSVHYKGFEISPTPYQLASSGEWTLQVVLTKHHDVRGETLAKPFLGKNTFQTRADAEYHSIEFGKQIVDGQYPEFTIDDLL